MDSVILKKLRRLLLDWLHHRSRPGSESFVRCFSYKDIKRATDDFHRIIDNSSQGTAYNAKFQNGHVALVKEVKVSNEQEDAFYKEVQLLGHLHHRHVVALSGFCIGPKRFLVFENLENGSLKEHLTDPLKTPLNWRTRMQIVIGVSAALEYLHLFCDPPIYHVSIRSSTIMLDENFTAKLAGVGLFSSGRNCVALPHSSCSEECVGRLCGHKIFQLGLLILELITGQSSEEGGIDLIQWVQKSSFPKSIYKVLDPDIGENYDTKELKSLLAVARLCIKTADKPTNLIPHILRYLQKKVRTARTTY